MTYTAHLLAYCSSWSIYFWTIATWLLIANDHKILTIQSCILTALYTEFEIVLAWQLDQHWKHLLTAWCHFLTLFSAVTMVPMGETTPWSTYVSQWNAHCVTLQWKESWNQQYNFESVSPICNGLCATTSVTPGYRSKCSSTYCVSY